MKYLKTLTDDEIAHRRELLGWYPLVAQASVLLVLAAIQLVFVGSQWAKKWTDGDQEHPPSSPFLKYQRSTTKSSRIGKARESARLWSWWLGERVELLGTDLGSTGQWVFGGLWMAWMLVLSFRETGDDYMHFTKRFGIIGASQLPLHYLLAMKSPYSPLQYLSRCSHEQLNQAHQVLGRIIQTLFMLHAVCYLNFFAANGLFAKRITSKAVSIGIIGNLLITLLGTTSLSRLRSWNYRVFYMTHVTVATVFLPLMYFHVQYIRPYILQSLCVYIAHFVLRYIGTASHAGSISRVAGTNLTKIKMPFSNSTSTTWTPGQHVYLQLPSANSLRTNPFTVASLPAADGHITLVARILKGNTVDLASIAGNGSEKEKTVPFRANLEGPYGASTRLPDLTQFDRVLLIAGGIGATFIVPIWRHTLRTRNNAVTLSPFSASVRFVWAVRSLEETSWALPVAEASSSKPAASHDEADIYVTGANVGNTDGTSVELAKQNGTDASVAPQPKDLSESGFTVRYSRPDMRELIDAAFSGPVERVAVLICGPPGMGKQVRREVGRWVQRGKEVFWHNEDFEM